MRIAPRRLRYGCALLLIGLGASGILFSPNVGLFGGREWRTFTLERSHEHDWGTAITVAEFELPFVHNQRGIWLMNVCLAGSLGVMFGGVHWLAALRRQMRKESTQEA